MIQCQSNILDSIANLTSCNNIEMMMVDFIHSIRKLIPCSDIHFYRWFPDEDLVILAKGVNIKDEEPYLWWSEGQPIEKPCARLVDCMQNRRINRKRHETAEYIWFPVDNQEFPSCLFLNTKGLDENTIHTLSSLCEIFANATRCLSYSLTDDQTRLINRNGFNRVFLNVNNQANFSGDKTGWLCCFKINYFDKILNTHGLLAADDILKLFASLMKKHYLDRDQLFDIGGGYFIATLEAMSLDNAYAVSDRFRAKIADYVFPHAGRISVSIGMSELEHSRSKNDMVRMADTALRYAIDNNVKHVTCYQVLHKSGLIE